MSKPALERSRRIHWIGVLGALIIVATLSAGCFCDSWPFADAWVDTDCDGHRDRDEEPLPGVCVRSPTWLPEGPPSLEYCAHHFNRTDEEGSWFGGTISGCATDYYIVARTPEGFEPTTDTIVDNSMYAAFGFAPEGTCPQRSIATPESLTALRLAHTQRKAMLVGFGVAVLIGLILVGVKLRARRRGSVQGDDQAA